MIGKDYELHVLTLKDGRIVSGMIRSDAAELVTVQTLSNEEQVRKSDIASRQTLGVSMMPSGLFSALTNEQMRDLVAYLGTTAPSVGAAANPVAPSPAAPPTAPLFKAPGALEGEELKVMASTGKVVMQKMDRFRDGVWSDARHLWWVNAKPGDVLKLSVPVAKAGHYRLKAVLTRAPDYAIVRFSLDGKPVSLGQVDLFGSKVSNTEALVLAEADFNSGDHELAVEIIGANPQARPSFMFGLDYLLLE